MFNEILWSLLDPLLFKKKKVLISLGAKKMMEYGTFLYPIARLH
jgi:hypothetical protein